MTLPNTLPAVALPQTQQPASDDVLRAALQEVERVLHDVVDSDVTVLRDASRHIIGAGGKRIRPRLVLLSYLAAGGRHVEDVAPIAAAVELVHTASVVHDDINDHGVVRRGRPSVNSLWGRTFALLTGDYLFTKVYELMAPYKDLNIIFADATIALVEGETMQAAAVKNNSFTRETYYEIIARKTAALFRASGELGARMASASPEQVEALGQFGFNIGLSFQIIDDILDLTASTEQLGKTAGIDLAQGRGFAAVQEGSSAVVDSADPMESIKRKIMKGDAIADARMKAQQLVALAVASLDILPPSAARDGLVSLAHSTVERSY